MRYWCSVVLLIVALGCGKDPGGPPAGGGNQSAFQITFRFTQTPAAGHISQVQDAVTLWQRVITGDVPALAVTAAGSSCNATVPSQDETIDDIVIWVTIQTIDGAGGALGQGGPCTIRSGSGLPAVGRMILDSADMNNSFMPRVIIHEMGHALGFGTIWDYTAIEMLTDGGSTDPIFVGAQAITAFNVAGGGGYAGRRVPVENTGGPGTRDAHWRESVFGGELMTGFLNSSNDRLSAVSAAAMADVGYTVNQTGAEGFTLPLAGADLLREPPIALGEDVLPLPMDVVDRDGRVIRSIPARIR